MSVQIINMRILEFEPELGRTIFSTCANSFRLQAALGSTDLTEAECCTNNEDQGSHAYRAATTERRRSL